jgi:hypothetical protein
VTAVLATAESVAPDVPARRRAPGRAPGSAPGKADGLDSEEYQADMGDDPLAACAVMGPV